jgi:hypothetical protein
MNNNQTSGINEILSNVRLDSLDEFDYHGTNPDKELVRIGMAYKILKYVIFGTGIIILMILVTDIIVLRLTGATPDIADQIIKTCGLTVPLISFILGHIFGKSQN